MENDDTNARLERIRALPFERAHPTREFFRGTLTSLRDIWNRRDLVVLLVKRELRARYKDSSLGILWSLVRPLAQLLIYYFAIGGILGLARQIPSFAIFVFVGLTVWTLFVEIVSKGTTSIISNAGLVKKVYLPREVFPLASAGGAFFSFGVQLAILLVATLVFQQFPLTPDVGYALLAVLLITVFALALALVLGALTVYFRDIEHFVEVAIVVLFWASPIVYSFNFVHQAVGGSAIEELYLANPITLAILGMQRGLWVAGGAQEDAVNWPADLGIRMLIALAISFVFLWISQRVFARLQGNFAQEL